LVRKRGKLRKRPKSCVLVPQCACCSGNPWVRAHPLPSAMCSVILKKVHAVLSADRHITSNCCQMSERTAAETPTRLWSCLLDEDGVQLHPNWTHGGPQPLHHHPLGGPPHFDATTFPTRETKTQCSIVPQNDKHTSNCLTKVVDCAPGFSVPNKNPFDLCIPHLQTTPKLPNGNSGPPQPKNNRAYRLHHGKQRNGRLAKTQFGSMFGQWTKAIKNIFVKLCRNASCTTARKANCTWMLCPRGNLLG